MLIKKRRKKKNITYMKHIIVASLVTYYLEWLLVRDRPRFFDQLGHQTTNASIGNKYFFTK